MKQIHQWVLELESLSPLRIGDGDAELVLDLDDKPFLPGTSSSGAFRAFIRNAYGSRIEERLFGTSGKTNQSSRITFSDAYCLVDKPVHFYSGIKVNSDTRTVEDGALFHRVSVSPGAVFRLTITLHSNDDEHKEDKQAIEHALAALHHGHIRIGAYKSTGNGKFIIRQGKYIHYDCNQESDLKDYVKQLRNNAKNWSIKEEFNSSSLVVIKVNGKTSTPLLVGGRYPYKKGEPDRAFIAIEQNGKLKPIIPATSLKGVLRYGVERVTHFMKLNRRELYLTKLFGSERDIDEKLMGNLLLEDIYLEEDKSKKYYRIGINPLTGGTKEGAILQEETVQGKFETTLLYRLKKESISMDDQKDSSNSDQQNSINVDNVSLGLLLLALKDLANRRLNIGSGFAIGYGYVELETIEVMNGDCRININFESKKVEDKRNWLEELHRDLQLAKSLGS